MAGFMNSANLRRVMVRTVARKCRRSDDGKTRRHLMFGMQFEEIFGVRKFEVTPAFRVTRQTRAISTPLRVVIPEEQQSPRCHLRAGGLHGNHDVSGRVMAANCGQPL